MGNMMFCADKAEALRLELEANARATELLREMASYVRTPPGALDIAVRLVLHPFSGWAIEADLLWCDEVLRHYESFELLELDLLHLQMRALRVAGAGL